MQFKKFKKNNIKKTNFGLINDFKKNINSYLGDNSMFLIVDQNTIEGKRIKWFSKKIHINKYPFSFHWKIDPSPGIKNKLKRNNKILCSSAETGIAFSHYRIWKEIVRIKTLLLSCLYWRHNI